MYGVSTIAHDNYANMEFPPSPITLGVDQLCVIRVLLTVLVAVAVSGGWGGS